MNLPLLAINEALSLLPSKMTTRSALVQLLAIGAQESKDWQHRRQMGNGPARGFWQFEKNGGVTGVMEHPLKTVRDLARQVCAARNCPWDREVIWSNLERDDVLAAAFARLNLYGDPFALPAVGQCEAAWELYLRVWRPGKPHPDEWPARYDAAVRACA
jgi:hypothetical protein